MLHLDQRSILQGSCDLFIIGLQERPGDFSQGLQLGIFNILAFIFGEPEQEDRPMRPKTNE
jgi:hypothetical protein